jgi:tripartite-type tricarboxylate transporter receptor subunit TctC
LARALAPKLSELWGQPVTVENHPGAGATTGPALVAKSPADGYTLLINTSAQAYSAALSRNLPYDPLKDFIPVASLTNQPYVLVAGKPAGTIAEAGVAGFDFPIWYGIWAPAGSPTGVVDKLSRDIARVLAGPDLRDWIAKHGGEPMNMTQREFARFVQSQSEDAARFINADVKP